MDDLACAKASFQEQSVIFSRSHTWIMSWIYTGTFGSFIGFSAAFPLLTSTQFPHINALEIAFLGPLVGALSRSLTGWISDRYGGARVTLAVFALMTAGAVGVLYSLANKAAPGAFAGFFASFLLLFFASGVGNASTFQMIPAIMRKEALRLVPHLPAPDQMRQAEKESAAIVGFVSAIAAFGAFFIPKSFGLSLAATGGAGAALGVFLLFYVSCLALTWFVYARPGGVLFDVESKRAGVSPGESAKERA
jgi:NNP family nitrate/nitrite transporter-like MFS transporter